MRIVRWSRSSMMRSFAGQGSHSRSSLSLGLPHHLARSLPSRSRSRSLALSISTRPPALLFPSLRVSGAAQPSQHGELSLYHLYNYYIYDTLFMIYIYNSLSRSIQVFFYLGFVTLRLPWLRVRSLRTKHAPAANPCCSATPRRGDGRVAGGGSDRELTRHSPPSSLACLA